jgi:hypothetical protein
VAIDSHTTYTVTCGRCGTTLMAGSCCHFPSVPLAVQHARAEGWSIHSDGGIALCPINDPAHAADRTAYHPGAAPDQPCECGCTGGSDDCTCGTDCPTCDRLATARTAEEAR